MAQPVGAPTESARPNGGCRTARPLTFPAPGCLGAKIFQGGTQYGSYLYGRGRVGPAQPEVNQLRYLFFLDLQGGLHHEIAD